MRWQFIDPNNASESSQKQRTLEAIDAWWRGFAERADDFDAACNGTLKMDLPAWVNEHLAPVDPRLCWEFGPAVKKQGHRLVITPENDHFLRPLTRTLLERAPTLP